MVYGCRLCASRPSGINQKSILFQHALQLETIAFSPDVQLQPLRSPPMSPRRASSPSDLVRDAGRVTPPHPTAVASSSTRSRATTCWGRKDDDRHHRNGWLGQMIVDRGKEQAPCVRRKTRPQLFDDFTFVQTADRSLEHMPGGGERGRGEIRAETEARSAETSPDSCRARAAFSSDTRSASLKRTRIDWTTPTTPASMHAALKPARRFDSGDMIMTAVLLAHPESSLKVRPVHVSAHFYPAVQYSIYELLTGYYTLQQRGCCIQKQVH